MRLFSIFICALEHLLFLFFFILKIRRSQISSLLFTCSLFLFFFNDTATTEIYTLSLHDALPICLLGSGLLARSRCGGRGGLLGSRLGGRCSSLLGSGLLGLFLGLVGGGRARGLGRSEEHTSELQSHLNLVCRLLLEKKKKTARVS